MSLPADADLTAVLRVPCHRPTRAPRPTGAEYGLYPTYHGRIARGRAYLRCRGRLDRTACYPITAPLSEHEAVASRWGVGWRLLPLLLDNSTGERSLQRTDAEVVGISPRRYCTQRVLLSCVHEDRGQAVCLRVLACRM